MLAGLPPPFFPFVIAAAAAGVVTAVEVAQGDTIAGGDLLVDIKPE